MKSVYVVVSDDVMLFRRKKFVKRVFERDRVSKWIMEETHNTFIYDWVGEDKESVLKIRFTNRGPRNDERFISILNTLDTQVSGNSNFSSTVQR